MFEQQKHASSEDRRLLIEHVFVIGKSRQQGLLLDFGKVPSRERCVQRNWLSITNAC